MGNDGSSFKAGGVGDWALSWAVWKNVICIWSDWEQLRIRAICRGQNRRLHSPYCSTGSASVMVETAAWETNSDALSSVRTR